MANQARMQIVIDADNQASPGLKELQGDLQKTKTELDGVRASEDKAGAASGDMGGKVRDTGAAMGEAGDNAAEGAKGFESFAGKLVAIQSGIGIAKEAIAGLKAVWDFAEEGAENQRIADSFQRTASQIGGNADDIIKSLDAAARGTVDDEELMQASTRSLTLGVAKSGEDLVKIMQLARGASLQFGGDAGTAFETINQAIGNLTPRALKQYGILVSLEDANEAYAKSLGVSADTLTEEQQRQALLNAVLEQGTKNFGDIGNVATTTGEKMKHVETSLANIVDIAKEIAASGLDTAFTIAEAPTNAMDAFTATAAKMREEVGAGRMSLEDYNNGLQGMAQAMAPVAGMDAAAAYQKWKLTEATVALAKAEWDRAHGIPSTTNAMTAQESALRRSMAAMKESTGIASASIGVTSQQTEGLKALAAARLNDGEAEKEYQRVAKETVETMKTNRGAVADAYSMAIQYTEAQKKQGEVQAELDVLNEKIAARGPARTAIIRDAKLSAEDLTSAQLGLAVAQEDLATAQMKKGETDAEFALRVDTIKGKIADYSVKLGEHTGIVGGATKAELEQKAALEGQISALQKSSETDKAKGAFEALTAAFRDGTLTQGQYEERAKALNQVTGLYTEAALQQATAQEVLLKSFADPRSEAWKGSLEANKTAIDGMTDAEKKATDQAAILASQETLGKQTEAAEQYRDALGRIPEEVEVNITQRIKTVTDEDVKGAAGDSMAERRAQAAKTIQSADDTSKAASKAMGTLRDDASNTSKVIQDKSDVAIAATKKMAEGASSSIRSAFKSAENEASVASSYAVGYVGNINSAWQTVPPVVKTTYKIVVEGSIPDGADGRTHNIPGRQDGGPTGSGGLFMLHPDEWVLSAAQRAGREPIPDEAIKSIRGAGGPRVVNQYQNNFYDALATKAYMEEQRLQRIREMTAEM